MKRWENHALRRYYQAVIQQNLFGELELMRMWGSFDHAHGGMLCVPVASIADGELALDEVSKHREKRGYVQTESSNAPALTAVADSSPKNALPFAGPRSD